MNNESLTNVGDTPTISNTNPAPPPVQGPRPNVRLASSRASEALPEGRCNIGMGSIMIPSRDEQLAGFYVEDPGLLVGQFQQYKFVQEKGRPHNKTVTL